MVRITEVQYIVTKVVVIFMFDKTAVSIHLRLKTDDRAMYSISFCLFSWDSDPVISLMIIPARINLFEMKMVKYRGASFCHVIRTVVFFMLVLLVMSRNHEWNGELASLVSRARAPPVRMIFWVVFMLCVDIEVTRMAEATD